MNRGAFLLSHSICKSNLPPVLVLTAWPARLLRSLSLLAWLRVYISTAIEFPCLPRKTAISLASLVDDRSFHSRSEWRRRTIRSSPGDGPPLGFLVQMWAHSSPSAPSCPWFLLVDFLIHPCNHTNLVADFFFLGSIRWLMRKLRTRGSLWSKAMVRVRAILSLRRFSREFTAFLENSN